MKQTKNFYIALMTAFLFIGAQVFASFPVKTTENKKVVTEEQMVFKKGNVDQKIKTEVKQAIKTDAAAKAAAKGGWDTEKWITLALWFFLGGVAAHRWYAGKPTGWNILFILTAGGCGVWAIVDLINILKDDF